MLIGLGCRVPEHASDRQISDREDAVTPRQLANIASIVMIGALIFTGIVVSSPRLRAKEDSEGDSRVRRGFDIAPVPLNLAHKNRDLVGLGSYLVNVFECDGCHSAGPPTQYVTPTGNPFFLSPPLVQERINPDTYLGGGRVFPSPFGPGSINIVSRNLTPDASGLPIGGDSFAEFEHTIRTGIDPDQLHPVLPSPFNGALLQVMPWPALQNMTDHDLRAIYEYLSAIPCIETAGHSCS